MLRLNQKLKRRRALKKYKLVIMNRWQLSEDWCEEDHQSFCLQHIHVLFCFNYSVVFPPRLFTLTKQQKHPPSTTVFMSAKLISNPQTGTGGKQMLMNIEDSLIDVESACVVWIHLDVPCEVKGSKKKIIFNRCLARSSGLCYLVLC